MKEYSYFEADGLSLEALDTVKESKAEVETLRRKLCEKFGAKDFFGGYREDLGHFQFRFFEFRANQKVPDGWRVIKEDRTPGGTLESTWALPAEGSPDQFHMASMGGLMERAARTSDLEGALGCGPMPMHASGGDFETAFVRQAYMKGGPEPIGKIYGHTLPLFGSSPGGTVADPIVAVEMMGQTYLRIPNKAGTEEPVFTPPDAIPVPYEKMIEIDKAEYDRRNPPRPPFDFCWGC